MTESNEQKGAEEDKPATSEGDTGKGSETEGKEDKGLSVLERGERTADRIEAGIKRLEELKLERDEAKATEMLAGSANAGSSDQPKKEESNSEYRKRIEAELKAGKYDRE